MKLTEAIKKEKVRDIIVFDDDLMEIVRQAAFYTGTDLHPDDLKGITVYLKKDILENPEFSNLTIPEVGYAIQQGVQGRYGEWYGLNNVSLRKFLFAYCRSEERYKALQKTNKMLTMKTEKSEREKQQFLKEAALMKFAQYKKTGTMNDFGNTTYDLLDQLGIINLSKERKMEFMEKARKIVTARQTIKRSSRYREERISAQDILRAIENNSRHGMVVAEAKRLSLKDYFDSLIEFDEELSEKLK